ncbi:uncharacterized protein LOC123429755 [Hordeum vulgare subsp. vulgare]|uniref:Predicted protein n=1 Tax=Hordeum vulgare subsp. vulgare TaxID=112509 RepID=F2EGN6_HORVV|nr:uncharacterized protein LOC123429755 [Hordeum vulgare subsp. vulgare]BAK06508.1 predicted protein [Hordeum vulgare subsp. vulgare]
MRYSMLGAAARWRSRVGRRRWRDSDATGGTEVVQAGGCWWRRLLRGGAPISPFGVVGRGQPGSWSASLPLLGREVARQRVVACAAGRSGPCGWSTSHDEGDPPGGHPWRQRRWLRSPFFGVGLLCVLVRTSSQGGTKHDGFGGGWLKGRGLHGRRSWSWVAPPPPPSPS